MGGLAFLPLLSTLFWVEPMKLGTPFVGLKNYANLLKDSTVNAALISTAIYVALAVFIETMGGLAAALLLNRIKIGRRWLLANVVLPWCLPPVVNAIIWMWIYNPSYGLLISVLHAWRMVSALTWRMASLSPLSGHRVAVNPPCCG